MAWGQEHDIARGVLRRKFWQESRLILSSHIQRCWSLSERVGSRIITLEIKASQVSKGHTRNVSREIKQLITTEPIAVWVQTTITMTKHRQSMTASGYCCYYFFIIHWTLIGRKRTVNFRNQRPYLQIIQWIKAMNVYESAKILTSVQTFRDCALHQWNVRYELRHDSRCWI